MGRPMEGREITLGQRVRDNISGFEGIVVDIGTHITGCTRYGVRPVDRDNTAHRGDEEFFYADQLTVVEEETEFTEDVSAKNFATDVDLGDGVQDSITGFRGIATTITYNLYNCPRVAIQPVAETPSFSARDHRPRSEDLEREWVDEPRCDPTGDDYGGELDELIEDEKAAAETGSSGSDVNRKTDKS